MLCQRSQVRIGGLKNIFSSKSKKSDVTSAPKRDEDFATDKKFDLDDSDDDNDDVGAAFNIAPSNNIKNSYSSSSSSNSNSNNNNNKKNNNNNDDLTNLILSQNVIECYRRFMG